MRIGVPGAARIAPTALLRPAPKVDGVEVTASSARDHARAAAMAAKFGVPKAYGNYADVLEDPDIDAVYVPVPTCLPASWTTRAIEAGKHVLCEKPFTANATEAEAVAESAAGSG